MRLRKRCFEPSFSVAVDQRTPERQKGEDSRDQDAAKNEKTMAAPKRREDCRLKKAFCLPDLRCCKSTTFIAQSNSDPDFAKQARKAAGSEK
jgi:hypothetical protein